MTAKLNIEYGSIFGFYWMFFAVMSSFCSAYLLSMGYSNSQIGIILAAGSLASVLLQPLFADWADRSRRFYVIRVSAVVSSAMLVMYLILCSMKQQSAALSIVYITILALMYSAQPLFNATCAKLGETGCDVRFGLGRSAGSIAYALIVMILGTLVENLGEGVLRISGILTSAFLVCVILLTDRSFIQAMTAKKTASASGNGQVGEPVYAADIEEEIGLLQFIRRNGLFALLCAGVVVLYFQNNILNNFMLQILETVGGDAADMGRIFSYMAAIEIPGLLLFDKLRRRFGCRKLIIFSSFAFFAKLLAMYLAGSVAMVYLAQTFQLFSFSIFLSAMVAFIDEIMAKGEAVKGQALFIAATTVAGIFASVLGGVILDKAGPRPLLLLCVITTFTGACIIAFLISRIGEGKAA